MNDSYSAGGVVVRDGLIALTNQNSRSWSLPKGHIDPGETPIEAAKREITEETGIEDLSLVKDLGVYQRKRLGKYNEDLAETKHIHMFLFTTSQTALKPTDPQNPKAGWFTVSEVPKVLSHRKDREFFLSIVPEIHKL